ncbi:hypothetical protein MedDCM-OCT-S15-C5-cds18 [uncultured Mediterranean phage MEDS5 group]|uniref:Uncharacterized protein n=1 Tax=uncultured Mediterranean phage MEDS5 group TaxID=1262075 RepID=K7XZ95_9CAUD|nr:hypothetical protein MedDCM-OCT-S15-C5-cds18 [uncultured Mediterranean phage MEDS5 group]BAR24335.1 phage tail fiber protein [uncultured Mediterranean phage uvMED]
MATHDYNLANATGAAFRSDLNNALAAVASNNSNATDPATTFAFQWYVDTGDSTLKIRNAANNAYINVSTVGGIGAANLGLAPTASPTFTGDVVISSTSSLQIPVGTTAQRPGSPSAGDLRFNSTTTSAEIYNGTSFVAVGGGATGGGSDACFYENDLTVTTSYSITANSGAHTVGPLVINSGVTVTVPATSHLVIS